MKEIGKERYEYALNKAGVESKPITTVGFFVAYEALALKVYLYYRYPSEQLYYLCLRIGFGVFQMVVGSYIEKIYKGILLLPIFFAPTISAL
jgi:hypothetical protein